MRWFKVSSLTKAYHLRERESRTEVVGHIEKGTGEHQSNIVYSKEGLCPTVPASTGVKEPPKMFLEKVSDD